MHFNTKKILIAKQSKKQDVIVYKHKNILLGYVLKLDFLLLYHSQVCPTAMSRIIYFMYTGHIRVTEVTVCQLLPAATMFQVQNVIDACCVFLERQLDPTNAIGIASFAEQHGCKELQKKANHFIDRYFTQVP